MLIFSRHALIKLEQRKINRHFVIETVKNPELIRPGYNFREEFYKKFGSKYLKVVLVRKRERVIVITVHWVAKAKNKL